MDEPDGLTAPPSPSEPSEDAAGANRPRQVRLTAGCLFLFALLAGCLVGPALLGDSVLLPAEQLAGFSPWSDPSVLERAGQWNVLRWDGLAEFLPWRLHLARELSAGRIPLWNPAVAMGTPFLANSQSAPLYPPHLLAFGFWSEAPSPAAVAVRMAWLSFAHLTFAGFFAFLWARRLGLGMCAAAAAGVAYEYSGFAVAWLALPSFISVTCWLPLVLLLLSDALRTGRPRSVAAAGAATGLMLLAGHLQVGMFGLLAGGVVTGVEIAANFRRRRSSRETWRLALLGLGIVAIGVGLAAPQLIPSLELSRMSHRAGAPTSEGYRGYLSLALPALNWVTLLTPDFYGLPERGNFWGYWRYGAPNVMEYAGHTSLLTTALALLGLGSSRVMANRDRLSLALILFLALLFAAGTPLCAVFYFHVPGFSQSGSPARILVLSCLAQAMLAGAGVDAILRSIATRSLAGLGPWVGAVLAACTGLGALVLLAQHELAGSGLDTALVSEHLRTVGYPAVTRAALGAGLGLVLSALASWLCRNDPPRKRATAVGGVLLPVMAGVLWLQAGGYLSSEPRPVGSIYPAGVATDRLKAAPGRVATINSRWNLVDHPRALLPPNASLAYGWRDLQGYDSLLLASSRRLLDLTAPPGESASPRENGNIFFVKQARPETLRELGVSYLITMNPRAPTGSVAEPGGGPPFLYRLPGTAEARIHQSWITMDDAAAAECLRKAPATRFVTPAVSPATPIEPAGTADDSVRLLELQRPTPGSMVVEGNLGQGGLVVIAESYAPGWRAASEGGRAPRLLLRVNGGLLGVHLPEGASNLTLRYEPAGFRFGLFLGLAALALMICMVVGPRKPVDPGAR